VLGAVLSSTMPAQQAFDVQQQAADLQQRLRVSLDAIVADVRGASLVLPYRAGDVGDDRRAGVHFRPDTVTVLLGPAEAYARGGPPPQSRTYYLKVEDGEPPQLMRYDGVVTTMPVVDNVISLAFDYAGEAQPPRVQPPSLPWPETVSYGPRPPPIGVDDPDDAWGAGENCAFSVVNGVREPRLQTLGPGGVVPLPAEILTDGPWCPDAFHDRRFDADVLRVRSIRLRMRVQAPPAFRGRAGELFLMPGSGITGRVVPDEEMTVHIAPRAMNGAR
jgi:hypothetical protein